MAPSASPLSAWQIFYQIVGSSAGALTGLQFVVIALGARSSTRSEHAVLAFGSPTVVHFCAVLLIAAILAMPWGSLTAPAIALAACAAGGIGYTAIVIRRARRVRDYVPVLEDWLWHAAFPAVAYVGALVAALALPDRPAPALFGAAGVVLLLIFTGIHNAWDAAAYMATTDHRAESDAATAAPAPAPGGAREAPPPSSTARASGPPPPPWPRGKEPL